MREKHALHPHTCFKPALFRALATPLDKELGAPALRDQYYAKIVIFMYVCIYVALGLSWRHVGSLVVACELLAAACMWDLVP